MLTGKWSQMFYRVQQLNLQVLQERLTLKLRALCSYKTSVIIYHSISCNAPEGDPCHHCYKNVKSRNVLSFQLTLYACIA